MPSSLIIVNAAESWGQGRYLQGMPVVFFVLIVVAKSFDEILRYTLDYPAYQILFQPLPGNWRASVLSFTEGVISPLSGGVAGVVLIASGEPAWYRAFGAGCGDHPLTAAVDRIGTRWPTVVMRQPCAIRSIRACSTAAGLCLMTGPAWRCSGRCSTAPILVRSSTRSICSKRRTLMRWQISCCLCWRIR